MKRRRGIVAAALLGLAAPAGAHRLDEYLQAMLVLIEPDGVRLQINLTPGVIVAAQVLALLDRDRDGAINPAEAAGYTDLLKHDLTVHLDGQDAQLKATATEFPSPAELRTGQGIIQIELSLASAALAPGAHRLSIENRHLSKLSIFLLNAAKPKADRVEITTQRRNDNQSTGEIAFEIKPPTGH